MSFNNHSKHHSVLASMVLALALLMAIPAAAQVGLGLAPMRLELRMRPGAQYSGTLSLSNNSGDPTRVRAEILDFYIDAEATPQFDRDYKQEAPYSCRQWLTANPMETEMLPSGVLPVRYTMRVPDGVAEGSYHCAVGFTTLPTMQQATGTGMRMAVRVVAAFYVVIGNPPIEGGLKGVKLEQVAGKDHNGNDWRAVVVLENRGLMYFRPTGKLEILNDQNQVVESDDFQSNPVLPMREQRFLFPIKAHLDGGSYTLRARVDIGTNEIQEARAVINADTSKK